MELPELQLWSPLMHFPDEVTGLPILSDVLVGESRSSEAIHGGAQACAGR